MLAPVTPVRPASTIAVLPFINMSKEADNEPFADGLSEEVINVLSGIQALKVAGRTSSFYFKGKSERPDVIAATLGVNHLLEGSVRWAGPRVRITAQLIDATNGFHIWSETFDREVTDVFAVQEEIARSVAGALQVKLQPPDEAHLVKRGTQNPEAHRLYLVARGRMRERDLPNLRAAKVLFEEAIERDPLYASAYSGLADAYYLLMANHVEEMQRGEQLGERAATRALELDPKSSEAHTSRANFAWRHYQLHGEVGGLDRAIADFQRAIELDPSNAQAHQWYGRTVLERDPDRALRLFERALELDPLMRQAQLAAAQVFADQGQYDRARGYFNDVMDRYPDFAGVYTGAGDLEWRYGHLVDARSLYRKAYELDADPTSASFVYHTSLELGDRVTAAEWLPRIAGNTYLEFAIEAAQLCIEGKYPQALEVLTRGVEQGFDEQGPGLSMAHLALIVGQPERATASLLKRYPELANDESPINRRNCDAAIALAASWQRTNRRIEADRVLRRTAVWLEGPRALRGPERQIARAQVHALLGERDQAFDALDRAFDEGHRGALAASLLGGFYGFLYRGEDNPLFESVRSDPRFSAWFARIHADNARQLAQLNNRAATR
jgi:TolB-like protein/tetratricopeptide (TPR) repeat protein